MKQIAIISGKGGTGKTTVTASFAVLEENKIIADCDVDAADLHLLVTPSVTKKTDFYSGKTAVIDHALCVKCGKCEAVCRFNAIHDVEIDPIACEGCSFCSHICPQKAITMEDNLSGEWYVSSTKYGTLVHAKLKAGEENSGKLVEKVREASKDIAEQDGKELIIIDGPPGLGCPVISSITGVDAVVIITEPTVAGVHDLKRVSELSQHFGIKTFVCINKWDVNRKKSVDIESFCDKKHISLLGKIPFDKTVVNALIQGEIIVNYCDNGISTEIKKIWAALKSQIGMA